MDSSNPTIVDIARLIAEGKVADNYQFFFILIALGILAALVAWFIAAYLGERGKLFAMTEKLQERLDEIRQTTEVAESVRTRIAHSDWTTKEYKTLLRNKLEQLMASAYRVKAASEADARLTEDRRTLQLTSKEPIHEVALLSKLYFSVMEEHVNLFIESHTQHAVWIIKAHSRENENKLTVEHEKAALQEINSNPHHFGANAGLAQYERYKAARAVQMAHQQTYIEQYEPLHANLSQALSALEKRAALLMNELIAPAA
jgi:hypothetical protein